MKTYLFVTYANLNNNNMTGAHRRFRELVCSIGQNNKVIVIAQDFPNLLCSENISFFPLEKYSLKFMPKHIQGVMKIKKALRNFKAEYNYVISFSPAVSKCLGKHHFKHVISLFREDLIGYMRAIDAPAYKVRYFASQEIAAIKASELLIVQCENDRKNLVDRTKRRIPDIEQMLKVQINNANASWMKTDTYERKSKSYEVNILFIGGFSNKRKGHDLLLPAVRRLIEEGYRIRLLIAGGGKNFEKYKTEYKNFDQIEFFGRVTDIASILKKSDFMVVPSLIDSCPNTVLEGMNAGLAVYGSNTGGIPDLLVEDRYMFDVDSESIYSFIKNKIETKEYGEDAILQKRRKETLSFDWGKKIQFLIEGSLEHENTNKEAKSI